MPADPSLAGMIEWRLVRRGELTDDLVSEVLSLYQRSFGSWPQWDLGGVRPLDHLAWKMSDPHTDLATFGGRLDGRLIHAATLRAADLRLRGERVRQVRFTDTSVDPDLRGRGVAGAAMKHVREAHLLPRAVRIGEPQHDAIRAWYGGTNRPLGSPIFQHARVLDARRCVEHLPSLVGRRPGYLPAIVALRLAQTWGRLRAGRADIGLGVSSGAAMAILALVADRLVQGFAEERRKALGL